MLQSGLQSELEDFSIRYLEVLVGSRQLDPATWVRGLEFVGTHSLSFVPLRFEDKRR